MKFLLDLNFDFIYNVTLRFNNYLKKENKMKDEKLVSIAEAARLNRVTRQAIYVAIKLNKLKAHKENTRWMININDLQDYRKQKYSRTKSTFDGELIFDPMKGYLSVNQVAKLLRVPAQKIYYATRTGKLKAHRKGAAWVMHADDVNEYKEKYLRRRRRQFAG